MVQATYLPHLDGVRALALLGVLAYHFKIPGAQGGFLGVDTFLVLSGYLMTRNILRSVEAATFSFHRFYISRFWRLYPAALCVTCFTVIGSFLVSSPDNALETSQSALASMFFSSNIYFFKYSTYFDVSSEHRPLLHTWSLSLEEQFYFIWPAVLVVGWRAEKALSKPVLLSLLSGLSGISFFTLLYSREKGPDFAFYLLPARVFEFGVGSLLLVLQSRLLPSSRVQDFVSVACVCLLLVSYVTGQNGSLLHTVSTLVGTSGIIATPHGFANRDFMSSSVMSVLGKLSYAAYLTHWPIWVLVGELADREGSVSIPYGLWMFAATFGSAYVLHNSIENPFRVRKSRMALQIIGVFLVSVAFAVSGAVTEGWRFRFPKTRTDRENYRLHQAQCSRLPGLDRAVSKRTSLGCLVGDANGETLHLPQGEPFDSTEAWLSENTVEAVVVGNSFAKHITGPFAHTKSSSNAPFLFMFRADCGLLPLGKIPSTAPSPDENPCLYDNFYRWNVLRTLPVNSTVFWANNWRVTKVTTREVVRSKVDAVVNDILNLGHRPILVSSPPGCARSSVCEDMQLSRYRLVRRIAQAKGCTKFCPPRQDHMEAHQVLQEYVQESFGKVYLVDIFSVFCNADYTQCATTAVRDEGEQKVYMNDGIHLSYQGALALTPLFQRKLDSYDSVTD